MEEPQRKRGQHHQYERLKGSCSQKIRAESSSESGNGRKKRSWRIRIAPRLRVLRLSSAKKVLLRLRDACVKMMPRLNGWRRVTGKGGAGLKVYDVKVYDEKVLTQIYMSLMVQGQMTGPSSALER